MLASSMLGRIFSMVSCWRAIESLVVWLARHVADEFLIDWR